MPILSHDKKKEISPNECLVLDKRFKFGTSRNGQVEGFGCEERFDVKQVKVVVVDKVCQELVAKAIESGHDGETEVPATIRGPIHKPGEEEWALIRPLLGKGETYLVPTSGLWS